ncbi:MAG TPA: CotD family spore coat protein [Bacillota bacterium]|nr:CotD family spore coat protein [Bacillota bacterium]
MKRRQVPHGKQHMQPYQCQQPVKEIVYPVQNNVVHKCSEEVVKHIHPMHTTVVNHHLIKNEHLYPHTTSVENTYEEIEMYNNGAPGGNQVAGATAPGMGFGPQHQNNKYCNKRRRMRP